MKYLQFATSRFEIFLLFYHGIVEQSQVLKISQKANLLGALLMLVLLVTPLETLVTLVTLVTLAIHVIFKQKLLFHFIENRLRR